MVFGWTDDPTKVVAHRPWPLPRGTWVMAQRWNTLLFAHWQVSADALRPLVPQPLTLDLHAGAAWVSVTPFYLSHLRPVGIPALPWVSEFPELNVRTYVTVDDKPGVYFFSLDAGNQLAVIAARATYHLPYYQASMSMREGRDGMIQYHSRRTHAGAPPAAFDGQYRPAGKISESQPGSLDYWLTERYCLYSLDSAHHLYRSEIHHRPWALQPAEAEIRRNTMAEASGIALGPTPQRLSFAYQLDVVVWLPQRIAPAT